MPVDPLQLQQQENLGAPTPSPIRPDLGAAEMAGQKIEAFEEQDKFKALLEGGVEAMAATRQRLIQEGVINETDLQDPTQFPEFQQLQNSDLRLKWWQELSSKIQRSEATKRREKRLAPGTPATEAARQAAISGDLPETVGIKALEVEGSVKKQKGIETKFSTILGDKKLSEYSEEQFVEMVDKNNPDLLTTPEFDILKTAIQNRENRTAKSLLVDKKEASKKGKKVTIEDVKPMINSILAMALRVPAKKGVVGRAAGIARYAGSLLGVNEPATSLSNIRQGAAGQIAKVVGGESGRLTNQDIARALAVIPSNFDTDKERAVKVQILQSLVDGDYDNLTPADIALRVEQSLAGVGIDPNKYLKELEALEAKEKKTGKTIKPKIGDKKTIGKFKVEVVK